MSFIQCILSSLAIFMALFVIWAIAGTGGLYVIILVLLLAGAIHLVCEFNGIGRNQ